MSKTASGQFKITMKTAKLLIQRVLGVSVNGLCKECWDDGVHYEMKLGQLMVGVRPYCYGKKTVISVQVMAGICGSICMCFEPETLEEDLDAEQAWYTEIKKEGCEGCVKCNP